MPQLPKNFGQFPKQNPISFTWNMKPLPPWPKPSLQPYPLWFSCSTLCFLNKHTWLPCLHTVPQTQTASVPSSPEHSPKLMSAWIGLSFLTLSPVYLPSLEKNPDAGKDWRQEEKGEREDEMVHHRLNGHELEQSPGDTEGQRSLVCCSPWGCKEPDTTEQLNNNQIKVGSGLTRKLNLPALQARLTPLYVPGCVNSSLWSALITWSYHSLVDLRVSSLDQEPSEGEDHTLFIFQAGPSTSVVGEWLSPGIQWMANPCFIFFPLFFFSWSIVDVQCFVNYYCTARWFSYTYIAVFFHIFFSITVYHRTWNRIPCSRQSDPVVMFND